MWNGNCFPCIELNCTHTSTFICECGLAVVSFCVCRLEDSIWSLSLLSICLRQSLFIILPPPSPLWMPVTQELQGILLFLPLIFLWTCCSYSNVLHICLLRGFWGFEIGFLHIYGKHPYLLNHLSSTRVSFLDGEEATCTCGHPCSGCRLRYIDTS